jgi:uncharacterized membrane protein
MKNRNVGFLIIGMALVIGIIVFLFNNAMTKIVSESCSHGPSCTMYSTIKTQTYVSIALIVVILFIGLVLIITKDNEKIVFKRVKPYSESELKPKKFNKKLLEELEDDEKSIMKLLLDNEGSIYQSELVEKSKLNKVKITRILDSIEGKGLIERKRRGMTNIVILKS